MAVPCTLVLPFVFAVNLSTVAASVLKKTDRFLKLDISRSDRTTIWITSHQTVPVSPHPFRWDIPQKRRRSTGLYYHESGGMGDTLKVLVDNRI
ncbi:hypothetical protein AVEN_24324-1 [Araneus ventricosus]|uniref:Secreted protein n=1 Tax=Araneus ventricosus TaxID=182803 RepID=A0A4Y2NI13_ARAVE|nr:hypothetical protein AVEN_24324-1 [Araneus ventricosus]